MDEDITKSKHLPPYDRIGFLESVLYSRVEAGLEHINDPVKTPFTGVGQQISFLYQSQIA